MAKISVRVQPGASKNEIVGFAEGIFRVRITAPPVEGKANGALIAFLAKTLGVRRSALTILRGTTGREKLVSIEGLSDEELYQRLLSPSARGVIPPMLGRILRRMDSPLRSPGI
ncbi:MAG: YggU family protein [Chloroflexi bacterium]|nr:YggU family protein [Chloroflexota bacterium]